MPLWVADFVGDTLDLDAKEIGAYMLLLMTMWGRQGSLPNDQKKLQRIARCGKDWPKVWAGISRFFTVEGDTITQIRLRKELLKVETKRAVNARSGSLGGQAKALKNQDRGLADATPSLKQPYLIPIDRKKETANAVSNQSPEGFDAFWQTYPHRGGAKKGRAIAERHFAAACKSGVDPAAIIAGANRYRSDRQVISGFAKDPATWLNQRCWADDVEPPPEALPKPPAPRLFDLTKFHG
jgi:uncharacterized protein YdaU (DUF1376 family)